MKQKMEAKGGMRAFGCIRGMDNLGRIVFPIELRKQLGWVKGTEVEISVVDQKIYVKKFGCIICGNAEVIQTELGHLCKKCMKKILDESLQDEGLDISNIM